MDNYISRIIDYIDAMIDLKENEQEGMTLWLAVMYQAIEDWQIDDIYNLILRAKTFKLSSWGKAQILIGEADFYAKLQNWESAAHAYTYAFTRLEKSEKNGSNRASVINNLGLVYQDQGNYDGAQKCFEQAIDIYNQSGDQKGETHSLSNLASIYDQRGEWDRAIQYYQKAIEIQQHAVEDKDAAILFNNIGVAYHNAGNLELADQYFRKCLNILDTIGESQSEQGARAIMNLGELYADFNQVDKAIRCFEFSISICHEISDKLMETSAWNNLGALYFHIGKIKKALKCYMRSLKLANQIENRSSQTLALNNLGALYEEIKSYEKAEQVYTQSLALAHDMNDLYGIARAHNNLGVLFEVQKNYSQAIWHYDQAGKGLHKIADYYRQTVTLINIASLCARMGEPGKAKKKYQQGHALARKYKFKDLLVSLAILDGDLHFSFYSNWELGCKSYVRACQYALQTNLKSLNKFIEIAKKRLAWLDDEGRLLLCKRLLQKCGDDLKSSAPNFYEYLASLPDQDAAQ